MRTRQIKKQVWLNKNEATLLKKKAKKVGFTESELIRQLITGYEPKEKPDDEFYDVMMQIRTIGNNLNQIARKANSLNYIDNASYKIEVDKLNKFMLDVRKKFLLPNENK